MPAPLLLFLCQRHDGELNLGDGGEAVEGIGADGVPGVEIAEYGDGRAVRELREDLRVRLRVRAQAQIAVRARGLGLKFVAGREEGDAEILRRAETERPRGGGQMPGQPECVGRRGALDSRIDCAALPSGSLRVTVMPLACRYGIISSASAFIQ